ncbi:uncharacterized protein [Ptychodera flava]|uniref:uncharacterized protein isoform X3 n=1 Tax=Ptychodera flava TaxID=63121 RepID=UPI00396A07F3
MAFVTSSLKDQLQKISCHFTWNLEDGTIREINDLTNRVEFDYNNDPDKQKVPKLSLLGYLSVSSLHKKRNSSKAIKHLKEALMSNDEEIHKGEGARGDRMVILGDLAWIYFKQGKNDDARDYIQKNTSNAIEQYQIAVKVKPDSFAARKACQEILKMMKERTDVDSLKLQASAYNNLGEIDSALSKYEQAYQAENSPDTAAELASIYLSKLDIDMADRYIQVLSNDDNLSGEYSKLKGRYHFVKGTLLTQSKKLRDARTEFSKSLDFNYLPGVQPLLDILAQCKDDEKFELEWFEDCAKIMYVTDDKNCTDEGRNELEQVEYLMLPQIDLDALKEVYHMYVRFCRNQIRHRQNPNDENNAKNKEEQVKCAIRIMEELRKALDHSISAFQKHFYPDAPREGKQYQANFAVVGDPKKLRRLGSTIEKGYRWPGFKLRFPRLLKKLTECQPASAPENQWLHYLFEITNTEKHNYKMTVSEVNIDNHKVEIVQYLPEVVIFVIDIVRAFFERMPKPGISVKVALLGKYFFYSDMI